MKKASKICLLIGGILGLVLALVWLILSIVYFAAGALMTAWINGAEIPTATQDWLINLARADGYYYAGMDVFENHCYGQGVLFLFMMLFAIPSAVISFILHKKEKTGLPLPIVLAVLSTLPGNVVSFVGAGLAIANWAVVERKEGKAQPQEEAKPEEPKEEKPEEPKEEQPEEPKAE